MKLKSLLLVVLALMSSHLSAKQSSIYIKITTDLGIVKMALYAEKAPITVANFLKYVDAELYTGGEFVRTVRYDNDNGSPKIEVIQGTARPAAKLLSPIKLETTKVTDIRHTDGVISMARDTPDSAQDQFFIVIGTQPSLDFGGMRNKDGLGFAAFGVVSEGMDIIKKINAMRETKESDSEYTKGQYLKDPVKILNIIRENP